MFVWKDYSPDMTFIEDWIDDDAARFTGLDDGWLAEYENWIKDGMVPGKDFWCKIVFVDTLPPPAEAGDSCSWFSDHCHGITHGLTRSPRA